MGRLLGPREMFRVLKLPHHAWANDPTVMLYYFQPMVEFAVYAFVADVLE
jgi:hypothetical protein